MNAASELAKRSGGARGNWKEIETCGGKWRSINIDFEGGRWRALSNGNNFKKSIEKVWRVIVKDVRGGPVRRFQVWCEVLVPIFSAIRVANEKTWTLGGKMESK